MKKEILINIPYVDKLWPTELVLFARTLTEFSNREIVLRVLKRINSLTKTQSMTIKNIAKANVERVRIEFLLRRENNET